jgi:hypothetical protein
MAGMLRNFILRMGMKVKEYRSFKYYTGSYIHKEDLLK